MTTQNPTPVNPLISSIEKIGNMASGFKGDPARFNLEDPDILSLSEFLGVPPLQTIIFSVIFILNFKNRNVDITDMARYLETSNLNVLPLLTEVEPLESKRLIRSNNCNFRMNDFRKTSIHDIGYFITRNVLEGIIRNDRSFLQKKEKHTMVSLLEEIGNMVDERDEGNMSYGELVTETVKLLQHNNDLPFVSQAFLYNLNMEDLLMLLYSCQQTVSGVDGVDLARSCEKIYEDADTRFHMRRRIFKGSSDLVRKGLVKLREGLFKSDREVLLTDKSLEELFGDDKDFILHQDKSQRELVYCENIRETKLFFNRDEQKQLDFVTDLLDERKFKAMLKRMNKLNMRKGIAILFHGIPGTGKTASAYEIARKTGRDLYAVDISRTKSMWFGESERIIKDLFDRYGRLVKNSDKAPILLFNEADAIFSTRKGITGYAVSQTENTIQNIILQEMENLNGIMIATTNLTQNLDKAFERRFLFKVAFTRPDALTRQQILMDKLPVLQPEEAAQIASRYDLSGGNIENVARKTEMYKVLHGKYPAIEQLTAFCWEEGMGDPQRRAIGF